MFKKFIFFILILNFLQSCGFTPMYSNNKNIKINIENINLSGDWDLNNYIKRSLQRYSSKAASKKYDITVATTYTANTISRDSTGNITKYQFIIEADFLVTSENFNKNYLFKENFIMENFDDELTKENYQKSNKDNIATIIINKLMMQLSRLE
jgi:hypothetical protein